MRRVSINQAILKILGVVGLYTLCTKAIDKIATCSFCDDTDNLTSPAEQISWHNDRCRISFFFFQSAWQHPASVNALVWCKYFLHVVNNMLCGVCSVMMANIGAFSSFVCHKGATCYRTNMIKIALTSHCSLNDYGAVHVPQLGGTAFSKFNTRARGSVFKCKVRVCCCNMCGK